MFSNKRCLKGYLIFIKNFHQSVPNNHVFWNLGLSRLTSLQFILCNLAGFYKQAIPQSPTSHLWYYSTCSKQCQSRVFSNLCSML